jgi:DNA-binding response OmpR family regulator
MLIQKQGEEHKPTAKEEYKQQYHVRARILIIDDEQDITLAFKQALRDKGLEVDIANDPLLALKNFKAGSYDLLIIDIVMAEMDGISLYEESTTYWIIKDNRTTPNVIVCTIFLKSVGGRDTTRLRLARKERDSIIMPVLR